MLDAFVGTRALVGGIRGARDGGGVKGFMRGAAEGALNLNKEGGVSSEITDEISEINDKVDTLLADKNSSSTPSSESTNISNPVPTRDWDTASVQQVPTTNGTGGGSPTFNPQSARTMNAVSDPNQVSPGLPFYQNT